MKNIYKKYVLFALLFAVLAISVAVATQKKHQGKQSQLVVGLEGSYPPFEFKDEAGKLVGFDVDLAEILAKKLGKKLVFKEMEFGGLILSLQQEKVDLLLCGVNITPERSQEMLMIPYHGEELSSLSLLFYKEIPSGITSLEDLVETGGFVAVESGSLSESYLQEYPEVKRKSFQGSLATLMDVKFGKSLAQLVEPDVADFLVKKHPEMVALPLVIHPKEPIPGFGICLKKDNAQLGAEVTKIIEEMRASGELGALEKKWFTGGGDGES